MRPTLLLPALLVTALSACTTHKHDDDDPRGADDGATGIALRISTDGDACGITGATATISADDMETIGPVELVVTDSDITGTVSEVPEGTARLVSVSATDDAGLVVYEGTDTVDVVADATTTAYVVLYRDWDNCPGDGTGDVEIDGELDDGGDSGGGDTGGGDTGSSAWTGAALDVYLDEAFLADDGVVFMLDTITDSIVRFDLTSGEELEPLEGSSSSTTMAVANDGTEAYLTYDGGRIDVFDTADASSSYFASAADDISSMVVAGDYLFTIDASGSWDTQSLYDRSTGTRTDYDDWRDTARALVWAPGLSRVFTLDSGVSPSDVNLIEVDEDSGTLGEEIDSPYHGDYSLSPPIRVLPDETQLVIGSGLFFTTDDLTYVDSFGLSFTDIAFIGDDYFLLDGVGDESEIIALDADFSILGTEYYPGTAARLFAWEEELFLLTQVGTGSYRMLRIDPDEIR